MITEYEKFRMEDINKNNDWFVEVNWEDKEGIKNSEMLKITFPDGKIAYTKREHMLSMIFAIGRPEDQRDIIPYKIRKSRWYETIVSVKAKKNIEKGENITFPLKITLPSVEEEVIQKTNKIITLK